MIPAVIVADATLSKDGALGAGAHLGLTLITLAFAWAGRGLGRLTGGVIIVLYGAFVAVLAATG